MSLNISDLNLFFMWKLHPRPWKNVLPSKSWVLVKPPFFGDLVASSNPPADRGGGGRVHTMMLYSLLKGSLTFWQTIECGFTMKLVRGMIITYNQVHCTDKYSQHSSIIWPVWLNGWMFFYELSGCGFESCCCHLFHSSLFEN